MCVCVCVCGVTLASAVNGLSGKPAGLLRVYNVKKRGCNWKISLDSPQTDRCAEKFRRNTKYMEQTVNVLRRSIRGTGRYEIQYSTTPLIRNLVIRFARCADRLGHSGKLFTSANPRTSSHSTSGNPLTRCTRRCTVRENIKKNTVVFLHVFMA